MNRFRIKIVPLSLVIDGKSYRDMVEITPEEFWRKRDTYKEWSSGSPVLGDFVEAFREAGKETDNIACTIVSKAMSVTYGVALLAKKLVLEENPGLSINIVDSKTAVGALGFIALEAARAADAGACLEEVTCVMQDMVSRVSWITALQTKQTRKFGRIPDYVFTDMNNQDISIVASFHGLGTVEEMGKTHDKSECFKKMIEVIKRNASRDQPLHVNVQYTDNLEDGLQQFEMVKARFECAEAYLTSYDALSCATTGPCTSISFFVDN